MMRTLRSGLIAVKSVGMAAETHSTSSQHAAIEAKHD